MNAWSSARRGVARHPVLAFMLISLGVGFVTAAIPPIVDSEILPFGLPLHGVSCRSAQALPPSWSRPRCQAALASGTSQVAVCAGGSRCAGT
jgi:hypothetical protein